MTIQTINLGNYANDGTGDDLRTAFQKVNANFDLLNSEISVGNGANIGAGIGLFAQKNVLNLEFKSLTSVDNTVAITSNATTVNLASTAKLQSDTAPKLGGDLLLNGFIINGNNGTGDVQSTIFGIHIPLLSAMVEAMITSGSVNIDLRTFLNPVGPIDLGSFAIPYSGNNYDFGSFV